MGNCVHSYVDRDKDDMFLELYIDLFYDGTLRVMTVDYFPLSPTTTMTVVEIPKNWILIAGCTSD